MARPMKENRDDVADVTLTIRITGPERAGLDALVAKRAAQLGELGGSVSAASVVRALIRQASQAEGLMPAPTRPVEAPVPIAAARHAEPAKPPVAVDSEGLRGRFLAARSAGRLTNGDVATALRFADSSVISRWSSGKVALPEKHWPAVDKLLRRADF